MFRAIQKFGLKHNDLPTMLWNVAFMLRLLTLNIDGRHQKRIPVAFYVLTLTSIACYLHVFQVSMFWFIFWRNGELIEKIIVFSLGISSLIGVTKFLYMYFNRYKCIRDHQHKCINISLPSIKENFPKLLVYYRDGLQNIVAAYLHCDSLVIPHTKMSRSIEVTLRGVKKRAMVFWIMIVGNAVVYILIPFVTPGRHLTDDNQIIWGLEPIFDSPNFEIARTMTVFSVPITVLAPVNITAFLIVVVGYTEAQMIALSEELLSLWEDAQTDFRQWTIEHAVPENTSEGFLVNVYVKRRLEAIMKTHAINQQLINQVEGVFRNAIAIEFALLSTALITDLLGGLENTYMQMPFAMIQVVMDCITGQRLLNANMAFEAAVYQCKWENFDEGNMKLVMVLLQNAQNTMELSAGGVTSLSYASLMSVIKSIYSAYAALHSTMYVHG